jgi:telomerase Cajal body protein 1
VERSGEAALERFPTTPSKSLRKRDSWSGLKGIITSLSISCDGVLATGTLNGGGVGLYGNEGRGDMIATFPITKPSDGEAGFGLDVRGNDAITQVAWSPCARYLYVVPRQSNSVLVYDIRVTGQRLAWLTGRNASTNQRLNIQIVPTHVGHEVWSGGVDGQVRVWTNPGEIEGAITPGLEFRTHDGKSMMSGYPPYT